MRIFCREQEGITRAQGLSRCLDCSSGSEFSSNPFLSVCLTPTSPFALPLPFCLPYPSLSVCLTPLSPFALSLSLFALPLSLRLPYPSLCLPYPSLCSPRYVSVSQYIYTSYSNSMGNNTHITYISAEGYFDIMFHLHLTFLDMIFSPLISGCASLCVNIGARRFKQKFEVVIRNIFKIWSTGFSFEYGSSFHFPPISVNVGMIEAH